MSNEQVLLLSTGDISKRLGLTISAPFIREVLKVDHAEKIKAGFYWTEDGFKAICFALASHIKKAHDGEFAPERVVTPRKKPDETTAAEAAVGAVVGEATKGADDFDPFAEDDSTDALFAE